MSNNKYPSKTKVSRSSRHEKKSTGANTENQPKDGECSITESMLSAHGFTGKDVSGMTKRCYKRQPVPEMGTQDEDVLRDEMCSITERMLSAHGFTSKDVSGMTKRWHKRQPVPEMGTQNEDFLRDEMRQSITERMPSAHGFTGKDVSGMTKRCYKRQPAPEMGTQNEDVLRDEMRSITESMLNAHGFTKGASGANDLGERRDEQEPTAAGKRKEEGVLKDGNSSATA